jgi:hypothetical protein
MIGEIQKAGVALAEGAPLNETVNAVAVYFDVPRSPEVEAVHAFLTGLSGVLESKK